MLPERYAPTLCGAGERMEIRMKQQIEAIREAAAKPLRKQRAARNGSAAGPVPWEKGELTAILKQMGKLSAEERPVIGQLANECAPVGADDCGAYGADEGEEQERRPCWRTAGRYDAGKTRQCWGLHPLNTVWKRCSIFSVRWDSILQTARKSKRITITLRR